MWEQLKRVIKPNGAIILFGSEPFSSALRMSNLKDYKYDWVWVKNSPTRFLSVKTHPLKKHENILVFYDSGYKLKLAEELFEKRKEKGYSKSKMDSLLGTSTLYSFFEGRKLRGETVYSYPNKTHFDKLKDLLGLETRYVEDRGINHVELVELENVKDISSRKEHREDKHYSFSTGTYCQKYTGYSDDVLFYNTPKVRHHPTQKPVALMEYLIKTYTNEGETVLDFTAGSGTTGIACVNTNRNFIGIEKDEKYFEIAKNRIAEAEKEKQNNLFAGEQ